MHHFPSADSITPKFAVPENTVKVLLIEDSLPEARFLTEILKSTARPFSLTHAKRLQEAIDRLHQESFDIILLDLTLPDSQGLASLNPLTHHAPNLPIVVLTNTNDDELAVESVRQGAQDYLVKRQINTEILVRAIRYAIERKQIAGALREANEALEVRVRQRTLELERSNEQLQNEILHRQAVQERLELAQKVGKIGTFEWDLQTQTITWTPELKALYGLNSSILGDKYDQWIATIHPDDRDKTEAEIAYALHHRAELDTEFRILLPNQETRWIAVKSNIFYNDLDSPQRMIGIHLDITERKQLEAQFLRAQRLESIGTLASGIAHDLNNILTPVLAIAQLLPLKLTNLNEQTQQMLMTLEASAKRGTALVKQILSFARGIEGKRTSLQVEHLLREIARIIRQTFPKSIDIYYDIPKDLWLISGDATQLHQVFMNLCVNARDAMPDGGTISLTAQNRFLDEQFARMNLEAKIGSYIEITVTDTGTGIPPNIINRIFDPFFTTKEVGKGTGLGLSAVLGIVKSHDGFLDVESEVGQGSRFKIFLPVSHEQPTPPIDEATPLSGRNDLILVVDDEVAIRQITQTTLETYQYRVITAANGIEAIALYTQHQEKIAAILLDMMMPSMDGPTTIPLLRRINSQVCIIGMSGLASAEAMTQATKAGLQGFLHKPFTAQELMQTLHQTRIIQ